MTPMWFLFLGLLVFFGKGFSMFSKKGATEEGLGRVKV